jgi:acyl carrier protein
MTLPNLVAKHLDVSEADLTPEARFAEDLGADFISVADLMVQVEDAFDITISADEEEAILRGTYGKLADLVAERMGEKANVHH